MNARPAVPPAPPSSTEPAARAHRRALEAELQQLKASVPAVLFARMTKQPGSATALSRLRRRISDIEYEIDRFPDLIEHIREQDAAAFKAWRTSVHCLPIEEALAGLGREACCSRSIDGVAGGCVFTGGEPNAECWHPQLGITMGRFRCDEAGRFVFPFRYNPRAAALFDEACERLGLKGKFK
jgi:hypothetical protein